MWGSGGIPNRSRILAPLVLLANLRFLLRREVVHDVELLADLLRGLTLDHRCNLRASQIEERLDVQVVRGEDEFEQDLLVNVDVLNVPLANTAPCEDFNLTWVVIAEEF